jgi:Protein of unknown function (DUF1566)/Caspase domain
MKRATLLAIVSLACVTIIISLALAQTKGGGFSDASGVQDGWYDNSIALIVGINKYSNGWSSLDEPLTDTKRVAKALKAQGFTVIVLTDGQATKAKILQQIQTHIPAKIGKNGRFVFYYSGHGQTQIAARTGKQLGYLVPSDGRKLGYADDWASYISMDKLRSEINNVIPAKHMLIVFDSCFSGTALTKSGTMSGSINYFLGQPAINVLTAGDAGQPTPDGAFSYDFVNAIGGSADGVGGQRDGYVTFAEIGAYLQAQIPSKVAGLSPSFGWWDGTSQMVFRYASADGVTIAPIEYVEPPSVKNVELPSTEKVHVEAPSTPPESDFAAIAKAEQRRSDSEQRQVSERKSQLEDDYKALKAIHDSASYSDDAKKGVYKKFIKKWPNKKPYTEEVDEWMTSAGLSADGTMWTDLYSELMWQVMPSQRRKDLSQAKTYCAELSLGGYSDWRLPTISELRSLIRGCPSTEMDGSCRVTDSCLIKNSCLNNSCEKGCPKKDGPAESNAYWPVMLDGKVSWYCSSSEIPEHDNVAWSVNFDGGRVGIAYRIVFYILAHINNDSYVRCVR